ncbi:polysaccharide deacetylase WbmS family protein [Pseudodesulfovibrio portus]|uniref:Polysaccharide deacetylase n=1 Tax=Pseudodesulfovibrio portus TaxID=231439 RepID=A0ABN6RY76_9BACT|nr:hypothetical protein [Pseudodesulfovibrio portus]BDQ34708.1 hypothetical protein JCM14722_22500 [Pseudodesulfovibrio portus]
MTASIHGLYITLDQDWAPDWVVIRIATLLAEKRVRATWFITHDSEALEFLRSHPDLFELGIHPNCLQGSTQGEDERSVLSNLKAIVPEAVCMRSHSLYQHSRFLRMAAMDFGIRIESNVFLPFHEHLRITPHNYSPETTLYRAPMYWADDYFATGEPLSWDVDRLGLHGPGLKVVAFHPIHLAVNTSSITAYRALNLTDIPKLSEADAAGMAGDKPGAMNLFTQLLDRHGLEAKKLSESIEPQ